MHEKPSSKRAVKNLDENQRGNSFKYRKLLLSMSWYLSMYIFLPLWTVVQEGREHTVLTPILKDLTISHYAT